MSGPGMPYGVGAAGATRRSAVEISLSILTGFVKYSLTPKLSAYILWRAPWFPVIMMT